MAVGGCDILIEMYQRGELQQLIKETAAKYKTEEPDADKFLRKKKRPSKSLAFLRYSSSPIGAAAARRFQRLTISQNSSAVRSVSYSAECACVPSNSIPAVMQAFDNTVCPSARPLSAAVSKVTNGWKGLRDARVGRPW
jgi:hypothetical protein